MKRLIISLIGVFIISFFIAAILFAAFVALALLLTKAFESKYESYTWTYDWTAFFYWPLALSFASIVTGTFAYITYIAINKEYGLPVKRLIEMFKFFLLWLIAGLITAALLETNRLFMAVLLPCIWIIVAFYQVKKYNKDMEDIKYGY